MVESELTYDQLREKRIEENKKKLEQLNLNKLSQALCNANPKPSPAKQLKPRGPRAPVTPTRRSSRVADKPKPNYKDAGIEPLERPRRSYSYQRRDLLNRIYASDEVRMYAVERAEQIQSTFGSDTPSFVKPMLQSHVTGGFWLGLPHYFCKENLPHEDETITLVDEEGEEFPTKYLAAKNGLSGGWRGFSIHHELVDGDALVFQLVRPTEFKVYIIRAYETEDNVENEEDNVENKASVKNEEKGSDVANVERRAKRSRANK